VLVATPSPGRKFDTRYVQLGVRILVDPNDSEDVKKVHALQDAISRSTGRSGALRSAQLGSGEQRRSATRCSCWHDLPDTSGMFGPRDQVDQVDQVRYLIGTAMAYGGNPERRALSQHHTQQITTARLSIGSPSTAKFPSTALSIIVYNDRAT